VTAAGKLLNPEKRWGGIMRAIDQSDFETSNIQYIECWMQDPFLLNPASAGGRLYFNLGSISEDILKDQKKLYENGLPTPATAAATDTSVWGKVPLSAVQVTHAFSNDAAERPYQDIGFDGLDDDSERVQFNHYLGTLAARFGTGSAIYQAAMKDPSGDNYLYYRDEQYDASKTGILGRYKQINSPQGNSPVAASGQEYVSAFTLYPDQEDVNADNTLNEQEEYFEYKIDLTPADLVVGKNFITDKRTFTPTGGIPQAWYQFRIPVEAYSQAVGSIADFKSIRFIRMFLTGFSDSLVCRFASLQLVRNSWRTFDYVLDTTGEYTPLPIASTTTFNVTAVNIEENSVRTPVPYVVPPGIERQQSLSNNNVALLENEQAISLQVCNLTGADVRGVYKNTPLDLRRYGKMDMFIHVESVGSSDILANGQLYAVMRLGSDFISNFYEIKVPLTKTNWGATSATDIWPAANDLRLTLNDLVQLKLNRNNSVASNIYYKETDTTGRIYAILGNPNLGQVEVFFLGIQNVGELPACAEVWFDELRLSDIDDQGGWAAVGKVDVKLADLGTLNLSASYRSAGFGSIDQHINERSTDNILQVDGAANLELGKLLPAQAGFSIPVYMGISKTVSTPQYDPFDLDIKLKNKLKTVPASQRDSIREQAISTAVVKTLNFTNVRKMNATGKKLKPWSIENIDLSYSVTLSHQHGPVAEADQLKSHKGSLGYQFSSIPAFITPFKKQIRSSSTWWTFLKDFNVNILPTTISARADINRQFGVYRPRNVGGPKSSLPETYNKYFRVNRS
jgi:cell surface protein SprA